MRDHKPIIVNDFRGIFDRGEDESVPSGYFIDSKNNRFLRRGVKTREGSSLRYNITGKIRRMEVFKKTGEASRLIILDDAGNLYDFINSNFPILHVDNMIDFSMVTVYNRAYITPHNGKTGLPGGVVYTYNGSGSARPAAGGKPYIGGGAILPAVSTTSGHVEKGTHAVGVAYLTDTGFISGIGMFAKVDCPGDRKLDISGLPIGPSGTVGRVLVSTRVIKDFNDDYDNQTYYFIPDGLINDNTATSLLNKLDFYDADLFDDASYLLDQLEFIPAGVGIGMYNSRLIVWGEDANSSIVRVSKQAEPEAMNGADGFATINPGDADTGLRNCFDYNGMLICQKSNRSYYTNDNSLPAATWAVPKAFDAGIGSEPHAVAQVMDYGHELEGIVVTAHHTGIRVFNGTLTQTPLTYNIDDLWSRINKNYFYKVELNINSVDYELFVVVPIDGATDPNCIFYADFNEGLDFENIKWDVWYFGVDTWTMAIERDTNEGDAIVEFAGLSGGIQKLDKTKKSDMIGLIFNFVQFPLHPLDKDDQVYHFTGAQIRAMGAGDMTVEVTGLDNVDFADGEILTLATAPGKPYFSGFNFNSEHASVKLQVHNTNEWYKILKLALYLTPVAEKKNG
jgi:hypothetical protein